MYTLKKIIIYPIKSLGGIQLQKSKASSKGLDLDRRWMLVDENGKFQTQREISELALFKTALSENAVVVSYKNDSIEIPTNLNNKIERAVNVFDHDFLANEVDEEYNQWFSKHLNKHVQLVKMTDISKRIKSFTKPPFESVVSMADGYPFLILGTSSMDNLNEKLEVQLSEDRFRPNLYVETQTPHEEDEWDELKIGETKFLVIKRCARCQVPTINQMNATKGVEPLKTLSTYRRIENQIFFGANMILKKEGIIQVGDKVKF